METTRDTVWQARDCAVTSFRGDHGFLSNMYHVTVKTSWGTFKSAEAAFQAAKCKNNVDIKRFETLDGYAAKREGKRVELCDGWDTISKDVMYQVIHAKFEQNPDIAKKLLATEGMIVEGNNWNDNRWGAIWVDHETLKGENRLGQILMTVRDEFKKEETKMKFTVRTIGAGKVAGEHCKGGVSAYKEGSYASAILLPYKGYRFNPAKDDAMEFRGIILDTVNGVQYNTYLYVAASTVAEAQELIRAWVNRKIGPKPGTVIWKNQDTCKKYGLNYACLKKVPDKGTGRRMLVWAFEAEHYEAPHFLYAKETMDAGSTGDIMSLLKAQETEIAILKEENSKLREDLETLRKIVAQLQVTIEFGATKNNDDNGDGDDNNDDDGYNGGGTKFTEEELDNFEPSELDDIFVQEAPVEPEPVAETPDVPEQQPIPETPDVPTAPTKQEVLDADKFVNGAVAEIDLLMTHEQKQTTIKNCDAKVMRAMEALKVLGVDADTMQRLVRRAKRQTGVFRFADIKVEDGVVYARQYMGVDVWFKLSIDNDKLVAVKQ